MKNTDKAVLGFFLVTCFVILNSCKVTWASFVTPKDNIENVPKVLDFLKASSTNNCRILEFDDKSYIGFFVEKRGILGEINQDIQKRLDFKLMIPAEKVVAKEKGGEIANFQSGKWHFTKYIPQPNESEIVTTYYLMEAVNKLRKKRKIEIYSQTDASLQRIFMIIYK